ncbi:type II toxin-antitoxin system HicA family toxin [Dehalococcoides mccartyi]|uniref:type II toxin-antitoxin system HicA family toxin n=1 Tax=Dehalococcoides mccartyi TaxID=61435 RepID=UPI0033974BC1
MSLEKLINQILANPDKITEDDCFKILTAYGYELRKSSGSHRVYHKANSRAITVISPKKAKYVKEVYVKEIIEILKLGE